MTSFTIKYNNVYLSMYGREEVLKEIRWDCIFWSKFVCYIGSEWLPNVKFLNRYEGCSFLTGIKGLAKINKNLLFGQSLKCIKQAFEYWLQVFKKRIFHPLYFSWKLNLNYLIIFKQTKKKILDTFFKGKHFKKLF